MFTIPRNDETYPPRPIIVWLERNIIGSLFLIVLFAPHSIAVTQIGWGVGMLCWLIRLRIYPRPKFLRTPVDYVLLGFFVISGITCLFSYSPMISFGKMRAASLFTIVYLFAQNVGSLRLAKLLALALVGSCMVNVLLTAEQLAVGKGVKLEGLRTDSPLAKAIFRVRMNAAPTPIVSGDIVWAVDGVKVSTPEEIASALASGPPIANVSIYHIEWTPTLEVPRGQLLPGTNALEQLGASSWSRGRDWRATGFYGHWVTYAEAIQLIASLALGLFLGLRKKISRPGLLLAIAVVGLVFALGMSVTRASWAGFAVSAALMLMLSVSRRTLVIVGLCAIPLGVAAIFVLQQRRSVGFLDQKDMSTTWREQVWKEGFHLLISNPRHLVVGIGMDSIKGHWRQWGLFDNGKLPIGHMHSNLLQIALERGVPALILWLFLIGTYARTLWRLIRRPSDTEDGLVPRGLALGALGGLAGFCTSGLVHYNWGDSEDVMILYLIMGLSLAVYGMVKDTDEVKDSLSS
jgi:O-antigen ligase